MPDLPKRILVGRPVSSDRLGETLLPKYLALPVFCSDPLSSVAYATEQIVLVLGLGGLALLHLTAWVAAGVVALMVIVVASYRQTCHAYPTGGGAYAVSRANLGRSAALVAASALLVDYVLTVAVSVVAGVAAITSAVPALVPHAVAISSAFVLVLCVMNLRGVKESGRVFALPTYGFVLSIAALLAVGAWRAASGHPVLAESASYSIVGTHRTVGLLAVFLVLRAFASGCTALTGVEAISNGVPSFQPPKSRNAATTLLVMGVLAVLMFAGITALAITARVHMAEDPRNLIGLPAGEAQKTALAQLATAVFGRSPMFYAVQAFTAGILVLAANTAFNGFPALASILAADGYLPKQLARRGDRLVFSNGIVLLALLAVALIAAFGASVTALIQLYIIGVFVSFTLSQLGMVRHWGKRLLVIRDRAGRRSMHRSRAVNALGAVATAVVLVIVLLTKFVHGAWIVTIAMPLLYLLMCSIRRHYDRVALRLTPAPDGVMLPSRVHAVVLVSKLHTPTLRALAFARATRPDTLTALTVQTNEDETQQLQREWAAREVPVSLTELESPYRDVTKPVLDYVASVLRDSPRDVVAVFIPEYVVRHWWEHLLHNQSALRLKARLLFQPGVMVISVPAQLWIDYPSGSAQRAGEPVRQ
ncbi:MAG: DNA-binding protein [Pseudonocardiales bacterium]|nr:MAG: DNA-binding protein [Pseudonocardiales bacterium]